MRDNVVLLHPVFSEAFEKARQAVFLSTIQRQEPLSERDLEDLNDHVNNHAHEFGWG